MPDAVGLRGAPRARRAAAAVAILASVPYAAIKVAWLAGSSVGSTSLEAATEMRDGRHTVGNVVTLAMALAATLLALILASDHRRCVNSVAIALPIWIGSGLLGPVALSLPLGLVVQAFLGGTASPDDNGLQRWVYGLVYGGFVVQAVALTVAFVLYARVRWAAVLQLDLRVLARHQAPRLTRVLAEVGAIAAGVYAIANIIWAVSGDRLAAPAGFETATQRSLLVGTAVLTLAGAWAVHRIAFVTHPRAGSSPLKSTVAIAWLGTAAAFASGVAQAALATEGRVAPATAVVLAVGTAAGLLLAAGAVTRLTPVVREHGRGRTIFLGSRDPQRGRAAAALADGSSYDALTVTASAPNDKRRTHDLEAVLRSRERAVGPMSETGHPG